MRDVWGDIHRPFETISVPGTPSRQVQVPFFRLFLYVSPLAVCLCAVPNVCCRSYRRSDVVQHLTSKHPDLHLASSSIQFDRTLGTSDPPPSRSEFAVVPPLDEQNFLAVRSEVEVLRNRIDGYLQERHESLRRSDAGTGVLGHSQVSFWCSIPLLRPNASTRRGSVAPGIQPRNETGQRTRSARRCIRRRILDRALWSANAVTWNMAALV